ncbi:hypothetical protein GGR50DRAFT_166244 [Xylaria sp. CBS 124048]|nr:hypothetical protein GGR50DRAFT_166244 [Xylaria sp. CBS 124048]
MLYEEAAAAYDRLFQSELFLLPESTTEFERAEKYAQGRDLSALISLPPALDAPQPDAPQPDDIDGSASGLSQTLYLAYKNHGNFALDRIRHHAQLDPVVDRISLLEDKSVIAQARQALNEFSAALDQDPSDPELWRRTARVAAFLGSAKISRYCLEAAIELDDDPAVDEVEPTSLAETLAGVQLKTQLEVLSDEVALRHPVMGPFVKKTLRGDLQKCVDPFPFLPNPTESLAPLKRTADNPDLRQCSIHVSNPSWVDLGIAIVSYATTNGVSSGRVVIDMPDIPDIPDCEQTSVVSFKEEEGEEAQSTEGLPATQSPTASKSDQTDETRIENENAPEDSLPLRKRSQSVAGLADGAEEEATDTKRSKRIRRREAAGEALDSNTLLATQLLPFQAADKHLFQMTRNIAENLGIEDKASLECLGEVIDSCALDTRTSKLFRRPMADLRDSLTKFVDENAKILLAKKAASPIGLTSFLEHSKSVSQHHASQPAFHETRGLAAFVQRVNDSWMDIEEVTFLWLQHVCASYLNSTWSDVMKRAVVQVISYLHEHIYRLTEHELLRSTQSEGPARIPEVVHLLVQMQFELHLDVYERITNPNSAVDLATRMETKDRLARWSALAAQLSRSRAEAEAEAETDDISLSMRFLWSSVLAVTLTEGTAREHVLHCWKSLRDRLGEEEATFNILLPNNVIMPEVSAVAADREISKLTTMDFFLGLFQTDLKDPVSVIDSLEPVLNPSSVFIIADQPVSSDESDSDHDRESSVPSPTRETRPITETASQGLRDLWKFLLGTSTELRLFLWARLGDAYDAIGYKTKQFSCYLKSIEMIINDFERDPYHGASDEIRLPLFMQMLKALDDLLISALSAALNENSAYDIVDDEHLRPSIAAVAKLSCILHVPSMYEDEVRVGLMQPASNSATFQSFLNKLREMQVRNWSLLYTLLKAGILQHKSSFPAPESDRADYLAAVHQVLGLRKFCKSSNKIFLRMMRVELLKQHVIDNWEDYLGQVLYDLYGLKLGVGLCEVQDHGCPPEKLERRNTMALVAKVSMLAHRMPMKDLLKSDLKNTIEHMQQAIGQTKSNQQLIQNLRIFNQTLAKPIHPLRLYEAFKGKVAIDAVRVNTADSTLAKHRWFFLLGMIAFTKFKAVDLNRRQTPGATDDLRIGATFLRQQLQFTPDQWDAWFRLAECFDYELDESVLWTADKMNKERADLVKYQRNAIHCYTLALSHSQVAIFDDNEEAIDAIHDLYHKFGMRMYASSREPFAMEPFQHSEHKRYVFQDSGTDTKDVHSQMQDYKVWKYAARLFSKAMAVKPKQWKNHYMYAKCIWKMYQKPLTELDSNDQNTRPTVQMVVGALQRTVEVVSALPKPRHGQDPILEPHYKIVSVLHKLVMLGDLPPQEAADILQRQPYATNDGQPIEMDMEYWEGYVVKNLVHLREKDRSNWQHRIFMRQAKIIYNEDLEETCSVHAMAAFGVLRDSMLTKTMVMNVWKCDAERPGRHHVYTEQYVRFVVKLLIVLKDRANFEALLRRLRKKGVDYYHFSDLWQTCCLAYLRLIRQAYQISPVIEDEFKSITPEEFEVVTTRVSEWCSDPASSNPALSALQEIIELKKLNGGLMKAGAIDDLINDCYTALYFKTKKSMPDLELAALLEEREEERTQTEARQLDKDNTDHKLLNPFSGILNPQSHENSGTEGGLGDSTPANPDGVQRPRKTGIRRADVLRRAEQAVMRAQEGARPMNGKSRGSVSSSKTPAVEENNEGEGDSEGESDRGDADCDTEMKDREADRELSSVPGSVHDSADDESDLSDVRPEDLLDEDEAQHLMFPNLMRRSQDSEPESSGSETEETESPIEEVDE